MDALLAEAKRVGEVAGAAGLARKKGALPLALAPT
jgi:hypothetical protein